MKEKCVSKKGFERPERVQFDPEGYATDTQALRAGQMRTSEGEHSDPDLPDLQFCVFLCP